MLRLPLCSFRSALIRLIFLTSLSSSASLYAKSNQVGFWWQPDNPTWGLSIQQQGSHTLAIWVTYNALTKPTWYALSCDFIGDENNKHCSGDLVSSTGDAFTKITGSAHAKLLPVGTASLSLNAQNSLSLNYTLHDINQTITGLQRLRIASQNQVPVCTLQSNTRIAADNYTDLWWGGAEANGWAIHLTHQGQQLFLTWMSYDAQGQATWFYGLGARDVYNPQRFVGNLFYMLQGAPFSQATDAVQPATQTLGSFSIQFANGEQGYFYYSLPTFDIQRRSLPLTRFATADATELNVCSVALSLSAQQQAARFLNQATFGVTTATLEALASDLDYAAWLEAQFSLPPTQHLPNAQAYWLKGAQLNPNPALFWSIWKAFATAPDQLRQRVVFALSEILVISVDSPLQDYPLGPAQYLDMLGEYAFGNYRDLLDAITYSPMMGLYLSSLHNEKEDPKTGRSADENFAREIMQLFTIGLYQLNLDGSRVLDASGNPIPTYTNSDVTSLAKVFTGLSWAGPDTSNERFWGSCEADYDNQIKPMQAYPQHHSLSQKRFLNITIPERAVSDAYGDIRIALDTLFNHPNVGPFIGKQLIQRLVTSNPSPAYVARVARVFNDNGQGVRGDMRAIIKAILLDAEARDVDAITVHSGKLREPVVRLLNWMRSFNATSKDGAFLLATTAEADTELAQSPLFSPSVFNFFRPDYMPPNSQASMTGLVVPEAQITTESSLVGYLNFMRKVIDVGIGQDQQSNDIEADYSAELALADNPEKLLDHVSLLLATVLTDKTRALILSALNSLGDSAQDKLNRVKLAIYLVMASSDYIIQN